MILPFNSQIRKMNQNSLINPALILILIACFFSQKSYANETLDSGEDPHTWGAAGGLITIELNQGLLDPLGIDVIASRHLLDQQPADPTMYRRLQFEALSIQEIEFDVHNSGIYSFLNGYLHFHGGFQLQIGDRLIDLTDFRVIPHPDAENQFQLVDDRGGVWAEIDHGHFELMGEENAIELRHANLSMTPKMALFLDKPELVGQVFGVVHLRSPVVRKGLNLEVARGACSSPNWPSQSGFDADVTLIAMNQSGFNPVHFFRCQNCNGQSGGPIVIAPNATLENEGTADVPWWEQFTSPQPPYGNDQHPYLIWNLYRLDEDDNFEQIAVSGVKHAFFSVNTDCPCSGGNILWVGCTDTYSAGNNDSSTHMGPRSEILPFSGQWGRCNSFFDSDCDEEQDGFSSGGFINRMQVLEADVNPTDNPNARYFMEAWYIVRDDINIFNSMGYREVQPLWNGSTWTFPVQDDYIQGPVKDIWVDSNSPSINTASELFDTGEGLLRLDMKATELAPGQWKYNYLLTNYEFMRFETAGTEPNLELLSTIGFNEFIVPIGTDVSISNIEFARADRTVGLDWTDSVDSNSVNWSDTGSAPLNWGSSYRFSFVADEPPAEGIVELVPGAGSSLAFQVSTLVPGIPENIFADGFELTL